MTALANLVPGMNAEGLFAALAGFAVLFALFAVWISFLEPAPANNRARKLFRRKKELKEARQLVKKNRARALLSNGGLVRQIVERLNLFKNAQAEKVRLSLSQAGYRMRESLVLYLFAKTFLPFLVGALCGLILFVAPITDAPIEIRALVLLISMVFALYFPELYIRNAIAKRRKQLIKGLPDCLDLLVICAEAGLSLDAALKRVANEMTRAAPEIADEFGLTALELSYLPDRRVALDNLNKRTDLASIRGVVGTLTQTEKYGTPLAQSLRVLATEFRNERMMRAEEKAAKLPATLTVPLILFIMPSLFVVLLGPAVISTMDNLLSL
jgi:tight adherence protein C